MIDIVKRLNKSADGFHGEQVWVPIVLREAAQEIVQLRQEIEQLRGFMRKALDVLNTEHQ